jgi:hypothetical protein
MTRIPNYAKRRYSILSVDFFSIKFHNLFITFSGVGMAKGNNTVHVPEIIEMFRFYQNREARKVANSSVIYVGRITQPAHRMH